MTPFTAEPAPAVFGYHELFHALTIVAVACQYVAIAFFVVYAGYPEVVRTEARGSIVRTDEGQSRASALALIV